MNKKYILLGMAALCTGGLSSQTLTQAKKWFEAGEFEKARPVFRKLVRQSPSNASYNFWYGACCYEGGDLKEAQPFLEKSAARKVINAYLYLGKLYYDSYRFDDAVENVEQHIYWLEQKDRDTQEAVRFLADCRKAARLFRATENVVVVDSFVVDKSDFLSAYKLSKEVGQLSSSGDCGEYIQFVNELGNKKIFAKPTAEGNTQFYSQFKLIDKWGDSEEVKGIEGLCPDYPFWASDGVTLYYAAQGDESLGGYDIFVTRYDSDSNSYLRPDNLGMPFNSPYNDYMYVVDDLHNLGWFASDRFQPEGKVCVYVFVPNKSKETFDYENTDAQQLAEVAQLKSIRATWTDENKVRMAKQQLAQLKYASDSEKKEGDFAFVVNDHTTYVKLTDFTSKEARVLFAERCQKEKDFADLQSKLQTLRLQYSEADETEKAELAPAILDVERRVEELRGEIETMDVRIRNLEISSWN